MALQQSVDWDQMGSRWEAAPSEEVLAWATSTFGDGVALACSFGAEDMVLVHMLARVAPGARVFYLDTHLLFSETYDLAHRAAERYPLQFERIEPELTLAQQEAEHGPALWERQPDQCCFIRKVQPLQGVLAGLSAWITGIRRDQTPERANAPVVGWDDRFGLAKVNPLARWTWDDVWQYIREHDVPHNPLHHQGYPSIGCLPCTAPVDPGADPRSGRWQGHGKRECGLHGAGGSAQ